MQSTVNAYQMYIGYPFLRNTASLVSNGLKISSVPFPMAAGVALEVIGKWQVKIFHRTNMGGFLTAPLHPNPHFP
jgi:hypothetical protein